jgi:hypothetical protein
MELLWCMHMSKLFCRNMTELFMDGFIFLVVANKFILGRNKADYHIASSSNGSEIRHTKCMVDPLCSLLLHKVK